MHNTDLILTLTGGLAAAALLGYCALRLGLSPLVGYLLAGVAVGPHTPGFVADHSLAEQLAEVGVILLMFGVGLHFHWEELLGVRRIAVPGALIQSAVATLLGLAVALAFRWGWQAGLVFGLALSVASTVVLTRVLSDRGELHTTTGRIAVGWLVVEDIFTVVVLVLLPLLLGQGAGNPGALAMALGLVLVKIAALVGLTLIVGGRVVPWIFGKVAATRSRELFTLTVLVVALGVAVGATKVFGVSMALGAFLAGMVVGRSEFSLRAAVEALPMRDAFAVLFFVASGMLFDPAAVGTHPWAMLATAVIVLVAKPLAALAAVVWLGHPLRTGIAVGLSLGQIGEFSFILAALGRELNVLPEPALQTLVGTALLSMTLNPFMMGTTTAWERLVRRLGKGRFPSTTTSLQPPAAESDPDLRAVVIGYGPVGQSLTHLLRVNGIEPTVIELNHETVRKLQRAGIQAVYGDADRREVLESAGVAGARGLIVSAPGLENIHEIIRHARELNPGIRILARTRFAGDAAALVAAGATAAVADESEVALGCIELVLRELGATAEQIDRERDRVRAELGSMAPGPQSGPPTGHS